MNELSGLGAIASRYSLILCDVWGVIHNGRQHFHAAGDALRRFRADGGVVVLVTNAPRPHFSVREQLKGLAVPDDVFDAIVTSGDVTLTRIAERGNAPLYHIGPERDLALFNILLEQTGLAPPRVALASAQYVVCTGLFNDQRETPDDYVATYAAMRARDLDMISANPDIVVHVGEREQYCSGALAERYQALGGRVIQAGKPFAPIYDEALALARATRGLTVEKSKILAIGDGLRTDVKGARDFGLDCLFITSGIHRNDLHAAGALDHHALDRLVAAAGVLPTAVMPSLSW